MKILQISENYSSNLADIYNTTLNALQSLSAQPIISAYLRALPTETKNDSNHIIHHFFNFPSWLLKGSKKLLLVPKLIKFCKQENTDIVITHRFKACYLIAFTSIFYPFKKKIAVFHGIGELNSFSRKIFARFFLKEFDIIAVSQAVQQDLLHAGAGFTIKQVEVIYNAIDFDNVQQHQLKKSEAKSQLGLSHLPFIFGQIARLVPLKGQLTLLHAFAKCAIPEAHLVIIGEGRQRVILEKEIEKLNLTSKVHLLGAIPNAFIYVKAFDIFVLSSIKEGFGLVLVEAAAGKVPLIATAVDGIKEVIHDDYSQLIEPENINDLSREMLKIYNLSDEHLEHYIQAQYSCIKQKFNVNLFYNKWAQILKVDK